MKKVGKPISFYRGVEPICLYCYRSKKSPSSKIDLFHCGHPQTKDTNDYDEPCTTLEVQVCPFRKKEREVEAK